MKLSVVSHYTRKGVARRKLCRFSSKLSPEVLSFVSYACLKFCKRKKNKKEAEEDKTGLFHCEVSRLTGALTYVC